MKNLFSRIFPVPDYLRISALGIDISDRAVKYGALVHPDSSRLRFFGEERLEPGIVEGGVIKKQDALIATLSKIRASTGMSRAHFSLPEEKGYVAMVAMPDGSPLTRESIELHLEEYVPLQTLAAVFGYEPLRESGAVVYAVEETLAASYVDVAKKSGFMPLSFELESQALSRALIGQESTGAWMILDIGREQSNLSIGVGHVVESAWSIDVGGDAITKAIATDLSISTEEARTKKEEEGLLRKGEGASGFESIVRIATLLRDEIGKRLSFWNSKDQSTHARVKRIVLCGGNASIPGLASYLSSGVEVPVEVGNPWINITSFGKEIPSIPRREVVKFATTLGLALRAFSETPL